MSIDTIQLGSEQKIELDKIFGKLDINKIPSPTQGRRPLSLRIQRTKERESIQFNTLNEKSRDTVYLKLLLDRMNTTKFSIDQILSSVPDRTASEVKVPEAQVSLEDKVEDKQQADFIFPKEHRRVSTNSKIPVPKSYKLAQSSNQTHRKSQTESKIPTPKSRRHTLSEPVSFKESILTAEKPNFKIRIETELKPCKRIQLKPAISNINELMKTNQSISQSVNWYQPTPKSRLPLPAKFNHREGVPV